MFRKFYYTDHQLVLKIRQLNKQQLGEVYRYMSKHRQYFGQVKQLATINFPFDKMDAEDIFQQSFWDLVKLVRDAGFELKAKLSTLFYHIAQNKCLRKKRNEDRRATHSEKIKKYLTPDNGVQLVDIDRAYIQNSLAQLMEELLTEREQSLMISIFYFNWGLKAYAEITGINYNTVKSTNISARKKMAANPQVQSLYKNFYND